MLRRCRLALGGVFVVTLCPKLDCGLEALPLLRVGLVGGRGGVGFGLGWCYLYDVAKLVEKRVITAVKQPASSVM